MKREIMNTAWFFIRENQMTKSEALKLAWSNYKLKQEMRKEVVTFFFTKVDGSLRRAVGTLKDTPQTKGIKKPNQNIFTYFDVEKQNWRSFRKSNLSMIDR